MDPQVRICPQALRRNLSFGSLVHRELVLNAFVILAIFLISGCGGGGGTSTVSAGLSPQKVVVLTSQTQPFKFTASSGGSSTVTWSVNGIAAGNSAIGTIDSSGLYTAPAVPPSPNTVTVRGANFSESAQAVVTINSPVPSVASVSPPAVTVGSGDLAVTVSGAGFTPQSVIEAGGTAMTTTFVSESELMTTLPAASLATVAVTQIDVTTPAPGGGTSAKFLFSTLSAGTVSTTANPMVATYSITSPRDANVTIEFGPDTSYGLKTWSRPTPTGGGTVSIFVAGMRASTTYHLRAMVNFPDGTQFLDADHTFAVGAPPSTTPPPDLVYTNPNGLTPTSGVVLFHAGGGPQNNLATTAYDTQGNLVWYYDPGFQHYTAQPIKLLPNGDMLINMGGTYPVREIDLAGDIIRQFTASDLTQWLANAGYNVTVSAIHHDILILPNGHLMLLADTYKTIGTTSYLGDILAEVDQNNNVVWFWSTFDHLDTNRVPTTPDDWTHSNAVLYSPDDGDLLLSMRAQSWIIKIDYQDGKGTGNILWRFGYQGDFTLSPGNVADWQYGEHFPIIVSPNSSGVFNLLVYDNGDNRVMDSTGTVCGTPGVMGPQVAGTIPCYTRSVNFQIDENTKTAKIVWQDNLSPVYSYWGGSTQLLPSGNYAIGINVPTDDPSGSRYIEVTPDANPQIVIEMAIPNQYSYRSVYLPSLYPGVQW